MRQAFAVVVFVNRITHKRAAPGQSIPPLALEDKLPNSWQIPRHFYVRRFYPQEANNNNHHYHN